MCAFNPLLFMWSFQVKIDTAVESKDNYRSSSLCTTYMNGEIVQSYFCSPGDAKPSWSTLRLFTKHVKLDFTLPAVSN